MPEEPSPMESGVLSLRASDPRADAYPVTGLAVRSRRQ